MSTKKSKPKFKLGERVVRIVDCNTSAVPIGSKGTVTEFEKGTHGVLEGWPVVTWDHLDSKHEAHMYTNNPGCLSKLTSVTIKVKPKPEQDPVCSIDNLNISELAKQWGPGDCHQLDMKPTNPKDRAATHRVDLTLFPETATIYGAVAMTEGDCKYGGYNYRETGVNVSTYIAGLRRHVGKYYDRGEWADHKTHVPHLANALACLAVLIDGHERGNINDDRPPVIKNDLYAWAEDLSKQLHEMYPNGPKRVTEISLKEE